MNKGAYKKYNDIGDPYFDEVKPKSNFSFDLVLWFYRLLKYWYLFFICAAIFLGIAYFQNLSWTPYYVVQSTIMLENRGNESVVSRSVSRGALLSNADNQQLILQSGEMILRTVAKMPRSMYVDYFIKDRFKTTNLYNDKPVEIIIDSLRPEAYKYIYNIAYIDDTKCQIYFEGDETRPAFSYIAKFGETVSDNKLTIKAQKTKSYNPGFATYKFRFLTKENLVNLFKGRISSALGEGESSAMTLTMKGAVPWRDKDFMDSLVASFQDKNLELKNEQADRTINYLRMQANIFKDSLDLAETNLETFQRETGIYEVSSPSIRGEIAQADNEKENLMLKERLLLLITQQITGPILEAKELVSPSSFGLIGPESSRLEEYIKLYNQTLNSAQNLGDKNPLYLKTIDQLNNYRKGILEELKIMQVNVKEQKDGLLLKYIELDDQTENIPPLERKLLKYQRSLEMYQMYYQYLKQRESEAGIQKASNTPDNFLLEPARITGWQINSKQKGDRYFNYLIFSLIASIGLIVLKEEVLNNTIASKEDCERLSGLPVIGTIENVSKKFNKGVVLVKNYPKSSFAESFRNMRVRIEYMAQRESNIVILVTSAEPADGKTFVATNIASIYQLMGKKVIIADFDLRRPSVSKTLALDTNKGLSNYLIGQITLEEAIISNPDYGFDIIPAGTLPPNPSELIKTAKTEELIKQLNQVYDYVIIDCSPVGLVSDAYILAKMADTTLFVVRRGKTNKSFFKSVMTQIKNDNVQNIALVFNDVKGREGYYGTSRYYGDKTYYLKKKTSYYHDDYFES